ncbi:hypothetical protein [Janibacter anophelis]|uniref:hypothetical protein n=1 Tax=Janibacter anophelis TaxID=319054 RepID=UPI0008306A17|nr:hypothetical protein [Janibacter anophelis]
MSTEPASGHRRHLRLASNRLVVHEGEPYVFPYDVDLSVEPLPAGVGFSEGDHFGHHGGYFSVAEALDGSWDRHIAKAEGTWLVPYLKRLHRGEVVTEAELIAHFMRLHGHLPEVVVTHQA